MRKQMTPTIPVHNIPQDKPLILVTNDDGYQAPGIQFLAQQMRGLGHVVVLAPHTARSGMGCAITAGQMVRLQHISHQDGMHVCACTGTPTDCVKLALDRLLPRPPQMIVSGVNHGHNLSVSVHYSGTLGAVVEGCVRGVPSVAFSLDTRRMDAHFEPYAQALHQVGAHVLAHGLPQDVCLNVNLPVASHLAGLRLCRAARGRWIEEWKDGHEPGTYCLGGDFLNLEPEAQDTDCWAISQGYAAVTPLAIDLTARGLVEGNCFEALFQ